MLNGKLWRVGNSEILSFMMIKGCSHLMKFEPVTEILPEIILYWRKEFWDNWVNDSFKPQFYSNTKYDIGLNFAMCEYPFSFPFVPAAAQPSNTEGMTSAMPGAGKFVCVEVSVGYKI